MFSRPQSCRPAALHRSSTTRRRHLAQANSDSPPANNPSDSSERGINFSAGDSFFRRESATARDLGVLSAALHRSSAGRLRVLDAMCGCGVRSLRYLAQADADFVWANDALEANRGLIESNLAAAGPRVSAGGERRWVVTHFDANRVLLERYLQGECFDLVDVDSFGSDSGFVRAAICAVEIGGLVYLTCTDGVSSGGHRPLHYKANRGLIESNLAAAGPRVLVGGGRRWVVTHFDANRLLLERYLQGEYFDLVDVDSFGSDSEFIRSAICAVRIGGLVYLTCTDGVSSGGHRPQHSLSSYGAYVRPMPFSNEVGLRMLIGGASREAAGLGFLVSPLFSYYSYHGPVFRVMLQVFRGNLNESSNYGFISYCNQCGHSQTHRWAELGQISCPCRNGMVSHSVVVSGPLWIGPLHNTAFVSKMLGLSREWGWTCDSKKCSDLERILNQMIDESDPQLPSGYIKLDEIASRAKINSPPVSAILSALQKEGYAACRSHINRNAIKTNCPMAECILIAKELRDAAQSFDDFSVSNIEDPSSNHLQA